MSVLPHLVRAALLLALAGGAAPLPAAAVGAARAGAGGDCAVERLPDGRVRIDCAGRALRDLVPLLEAAVPGLSVLVPATLQPLPVAPLRVDGDLSDVIASTLQGFDYVMVQASGDDGRDRIEVQILAPPPAGAPAAGSAPVAAPTGADDAAPTVLVVGDHPVNGAADQPAARAAQASLLAARAAPQLDASMQGVDAMRGAWVSSGRFDAGGERILSDLGRTRRPEAPVAGPPGRTGKADGRQALNVPMLPAGTPLPVVPR